MITNLLHKDYCISVQAIPNAIDRTLFVPTVEISAEDGKPILEMMTTQSFADRSDAERCGFEMGKDWIDKRLEEMEPQRRRA